MSGVLSGRPIGSGVDGSVGVSSREPPRIEPELMKMMMGMVTAQVENLWQEREEKLEMESRMAKLEALWADKEEKKRRRMEVLEQAVAEASPQAGSCCEVDCRNGLWVYPRGGQPRRAPGEPRAPKYPQNCGDDH